MTVSYEDAVRQAEWAINECGEGHLPPRLSASTLRALLSGPPEPSEPVAFGTGMLVIGVAPNACGERRRYSNAL